MLIQVLIVVIVSAAQATYLHGGKSTSSREDDIYGNYVFRYDIEDPLGASNGRYEIGDAYGNKRGGYQINDIDGRSRWVEYIADEHGFRVVVNTNEPGTAASRPASAVISSPYTENQPTVPVAPVDPIPVESVKTVHPVAVDHISQTVHEVPIESVKGISHPIAVAPVAPVPVGSVSKGHPIAIDHIPQVVQEVPIGSVKGVSHPVAVAPVAPMPVGSVNKGHPVAIDHISQTVHEVPVGSVKGIFRPVDPVAPVPVGSVNKGHPVAVDHISQTIHQVPIEPVKGISHPIPAGISQTVHDVPFGSGKTVQQPVHVDHFPQTVQQPVHVDHFPQTVQQPVPVDHFPQTVQEIPFVKETFRPVKIAQTVHTPRKVFSSGIHRVSPVIRKARTFREAQAAHAASLRPNLYNGEYSVKYTQPSPPVVKKVRPAKLHRYHFHEYPAAPRTDALQLISSAPIADVSGNVVPLTSVHASPVNHAKGTPFHQNGLFRHVYGSSLKKPGYFRSHLL